MQILRIDALDPAVAHFLFQSASPKGEPPVVEEVIFGLGISAPHHYRGLLHQGLVFPIAQSYTCHNALLWPSKLGLPGPTAGVLVYMSCAMNAGFPTLFLCFRFRDREQGQQ